MNAADAQRAGGAFKGQRFGVVLGNIVERLMREAEMDIFIHRMKRYACEKTGQKQVKVAELQGAVFLTGNPGQRFDQRFDFARLAALFNQRIDRKHRSEGMAEFSDGFRRKNEAEAACILGNGVIAMRNRGKSHDDIAYLQGIGLRGDADFQIARQKAEDFHHIVYMGRKRVITDRADKNRLIPLFIKQAFHAYPSLLPGRMF